MGLLSYELLTPKEYQTPADWAEENIYISLGNARPGMISFADMPYQRDIINTVADEDVQRITLQCGAQVGKTMCALCIMGYYVDFAPRSQIVMMPTETDSKIWTETKFIPMWLDNPALMSKISKPYEKQLGKTSSMELRSFPGGWLFFSWAGSGNTARSRSAPITICDEVDAYEHLPEGHPVDLLWQRSATFGTQRKLIELSTPTIKQTSRIESSYEDGDQRKYYVVCPQCKTEQTLEWSEDTIRYELDKFGGVISESVFYHCYACNKAFDDDGRRELVSSPESRWIASKDFRGHASFHLNVLYSPMRTLEDIVKTYVALEKKNDLQVFYNTYLGEAWNTIGEQTDSNVLYARREDYELVPKQVKVLTVGIDVQSDRVECEVIGWGDSEESWSVDYEIIYGDPTTHYLWNDLDKYLITRFPKEGGGELSIRVGGIDTGYNTQNIYDYVLRHNARKKKPILLALKGIGGWERDPFTITNRHKKVKGKKPPLWSVAVDVVKQNITRKLNIEEPGPSFCHFNMDRDIDYFNQLTAEQLVTKIIRGFPKREWQKVYDFNEAFDCRIYGYSAYKITFPHGVSARKTKKISGSILNNDE